MNGFEPGSTLFRRYRLERLLVAQAGVAVWEATDLHYERRVQLSLFEEGSTMLDHGRIGGGNFVVIDPPRAARLELALDLDEEASFAFMMPRPTRAWRWAAAGLACAVLAVGGFWIARDPGPPPMSVTTLTSARIRIPPPPPPQPSAAPSEVPSAEPEHHDPPPKKPKPRPKSWEEEPIRF